MNWSTGYARAMIDAYVTRQMLEGFGVRPAVQLSTSATWATVGGELFDSATTAYQDADRTTKALSSRGVSEEK